MENEKTNSVDHDILIGIGVKVERLILDVKSLSDNVVGKIDKLECDKADKIEMNLLHNSTLKRLEVIDNKISALEQWRYLLVGGIGVMLFVINYIIKKYF